MSIYTGIVLKVPIYMCVCSKSSLLPFQIFLEMVKSAGESGRLHHWYIPGTSWGIDGFLLGILRRREYGKRRKGSGLV